MRTHELCAVPSRIPQRPRALGALAAALLLGLAAACSSQGGAPAAAQGQTATLRTVSVPVDGMSCIACVGRVKKALGQLAGVSEVEVDLGQRTARVRYAAGQVSHQQLTAAIQALGYRAGTPVEVAP